MSKDKEALRKMSTAVIHGPQKKRLKLRGHHWNIKKAKAVRLNKKAGTGVITGTISHNVKFVDDDQIKYEITFKGRTTRGVLKKPDVEIKIKNAMWSKIGAKAVGKIVAWFTEDSKKGNTAEQHGEDLFKGVHGKWREEAPKLVYYIAFLYGEILGAVHKQPKKPAPKPTLKKVKFGRDQVFQAKFLKTANKGN